MLGSIEPRSNSALHTAVAGIASKVKIAAGPAATSIAGDIGAHIAKSCSLGTG